MSPYEAMRIANERELDLIEIVPNSVPPVCKIMDFGKYQYDKTKKEKLQRKHQHSVQVKELRFHLQIDTHDFEFKMRHARHFIEEGNKVKIVVVFRGRQKIYKDQGNDMLKKINEQLSDIAKTEQENKENKMEGNQIIVVYIPDKSRKQSKKIEENLKTKTE